MRTEASARHVLEFLPQPPHLGDESKGFTRRLHPTLPAHVEALVRVNEQAVLGFDGVEVESVAWGVAAHRDTPLGW
jgi:hypothetical protein